MKAGSVVMLVLGALLTMMGLGALSGAAVAGWANYEQRDGRYFLSPTEPFIVDSYALTSSQLEVADSQAGPTRLPFNVGSIKLRAESIAGKDVFIGIAPRADVDRYLAGVSHSEVTQLRTDPFRVQYRDLPGSTAPGAPASQSFWTASASGPGSQEINSTIQPGNWAVVIMNADASPRVAVNLQAGFRSDLLLPLAMGLLIGGAVLALIGIPLIVAGAVGLGRGLQGTNRNRAPGSGPTPGPGPTLRPGPEPGPAPAPGRMQILPAGPAPGVAGPGADPPSDDWTPYPSRLSGFFDPGVSRWLWLVKWLLAIPHYIILIGLWLALIITTIVAGFAILFTGRYPESIFHFNVGVLRWNWRVAFYTYSALGTDRYPPFTLARTDYPADFDVAYPARLSRGLVLVKWWLLAIPHLLIVAAFTGSIWTWWQRNGTGTMDDARVSGPSLLGLLVLIAAVSLLFTGRYPQGLFDLILGINRWVYRVITYVALLRDEYPPFRLEQGPLELVEPREPHSQQPWPPQAPPPPAPPPLD